MFICGLCYCEFLISAFLLSPPLFGHIYAVLSLSICSVCDVCLVQIYYSLCRVIFSVMHVSRKQKQRATIYRNDCVLVTVCFEKSNFLFHFHKTQTFVPHFSVQLKLKLLGKVFFATIVVVVSFSFCMCIVYVGSFYFLAVCCLSQCIWIINYYIT